MNGNVGSKARHLTALAFFHRWVDAASALPCLRAASTRSSRLAFSWCGQRGLLSLSRVVPVDASTSASLRSAHGLHRCFLGTTGLPPGGGSQDHRANGGTQAATTVQRESTRPLPIAVAITSITSCPTAIRTPNHRHLQPRNRSNGPSFPRRVLPPASIGSVEWVPRYTRHGRGGEVDRGASGHSSQPSSQRRAASSQHPASQSPSQSP